MDKLESDNTSENDISKFDNLLQFIVQKVSYCFNLFAKIVYFHEKWKSICLDVLKISLCRGNIIQGVKFKLSDF